MEKYKLYKVAKSKIRIIYKLILIDRRFKVLEELNPLQEWLEFQDKITLKSRIKLNNDMILEILYNPSYISIYQPFEQGQERKVVLKSIKYSEPIEIIKEVLRVIDSIESFYV